jgi:hypothetical protein
MPSEAWAARSAIAALQHHLLAPSDEPRIVSGVLNQAANEPPPRLAGVPSASNGGSFSARSGWRDGSARRGRTPDALGRCRAAARGAARP